MNTKLPFDKEIEIAKLEAKISEYNSLYYTIVAAALGGFVGLYSLAAVLTIDFDSLFRIIISVVIVILFGCTFILLLRSNKRKRIAFKKEFEKIYNKEQISY